MAYSRLCTDPWSRVLIKSNGDVSLCCVAGPVGNIARSDLYDIISNGGKMYRDGLLTGNLPAACQKCIAKMKCTIEEERAAVEEYLANGTER